MQSEAETETGPLTHFPSGYSGQGRVGAKATGRSSAASPAGAVSGLAHLGLEGASLLKASAAQACSATRTSPLEVLLGNKTGVK